MPRRLADTRVHSGRALTDPQLWSLEETKCFWPQGRGGDQVIAWSRVFVDVQPREQTNPKYQYKKYLKGLFMLPSWHVN